MKILSTKSYDRRFRSFIKKHPNLKEQYSKTLFLLAANATHPSLRLHKLKGTLSDYYSISINKKYRIVMDFIIRDDVVILIDIGSHKEVY